MTHPITRFEGDENKGRLLDSIRRQELVDRDDELAQMIIAEGDLKKLDAGDVLIKQGGWDTDLYLILAGKLEVTIRGQVIGVRQPGTHVGERAQLHGEQQRTATITALEDAVVMSISYEAMAKITDAYPKVWQPIAKTLDDRLKARDEKVGAVNERPMVFVISSGENLKIAHHLQVQLDSKAIDVNVWDKGIFRLSDYAISSLEDAIARHDFSIAIMGADDQLVTRKVEHAVPRDNVHFEYGISVGRLGRERSLMLVDEDENIKLASDQAGLTTLRYRSSDMERTVSKACIQARAYIEEVGPIRDR